MRTRSKFFWPAALITALLVSVAATGVAVADNLLTDGDAVNPGFQPTLAFGNVCAGTSYTSPVSLAISRNGSAGSTNVFKDSATVTLTRGAISGTGLSAPSALGTISLPSNWGSLSNNTLSSALATSVSLLPAGSGAQSGTVDYSASGLNSSGTTINRGPVTLSVSWTIVSCTPPNTPPTITVPADIQVEATGPSGTVVTFSVSGNDAEDGTLTPTCDHNSGDTFPLGTATVHCSVTDSDGASASGSFQITVVDTTGPSLSLPTDMSAEATSASGASVNYSASATDLVDGPVSISCSPAFGSTFPLGTTTVSCSASDSRGNSSSGSFHITVQDTTGPLLSLPGDMTAEATGASGAAVSYSASATDLVDGPVSVSCSPASGSTFALGTTTVSCSASDSHGNSSSDSFKVSVQDTTAPSLTVGDVTAEAAGPSGATVTYTASATDLVDGPVPVTCSSASGDTFPLGTTTVDCFATDSHGNTGHASLHVTIQDTTAPVLLLPADITAEATGPAGADVTFTASASDTVDGAVAVGCTPASGSTFALDATTTVNCSASDSHGNTASGSFKVKVVDTTGPEVTVPSNITVEATGASGAAVSYSASATDLVDGALSASCSPASGSTFALGSTTVHCSATDAHGNLGSNSFHVDVVDTTPPTLDLPSDMTAEATGPSGAAVSFSASASDIVDGSITPSCSPASGSTFALVTTTVNCSATDASGNSTSGSFKVTVEDTTPPTLSLPSDMTAEATGPSGAAVSFSASASDIVDGSITPTCSPASGSTFPLGSTLVSCHATDAHGNTGSGTFMVVVQDTTAPSLTLPSTITKEATGPSGAAVSYSATASDLVDGPVGVSCSPASGSTFSIGTTTVNCSATDGHGNSASGHFDVKVQDTAGPVLTLPPNIAVNATSNSQATVSYTASASDAVDGSVPVSCSPASGSSFAIGATTVDCSATDSHGNSTTGHFTVTVWFGWNGFFQPVDNNALNVAKSGSAIPVKFSLTGNQGLNIFAAGFPKSYTINCDSSLQTDAIEQTVTAGSSSLSYDATSDQYIYVWKTDKSWAGTCRQLHVQFTDGTNRYASFKFTR